jgi:hypothetical protein
MLVLLTIKTDAVWQLDLHITTIKKIVDWHLNLNLNLEARNQVEEAAKADIVNT